MEKYLQPTNQLFPCVLRFLFTVYNVNKNTKTSTYGDISKKAVLQGKPSSWEVKCHLLTVFGLKLYPYFGFLVMSFHCQIESTVRIRTKGLVLTIGNMYWSGIRIPTVMYNNIQCTMLY